jgi:hypothetical protein
MVVPSALVWVDVANTLINTPIITPSRKNPTAIPYMKALVTPPMGCLLSWVLDPGDDINKQHSTAAYEQPH